ncbi:MAG: hypothetical protein R2754_15920 [Microthrixaceae bacterium]
MGGSDGLLAGVLVAVVGTLIVVNVWSVVSARTDTDAAVREYLRVYTRATSSSEGATQAEAAARAQLTASGRNDSRIWISTPDGSSFGPCAVVRVTIRLRAPAVRVPGLMNAGSHTVSSNGAEVIDPWRAMSRGSAWRPGGVACGG